MALAGKEKIASIVSCGNCKILKETDVEKIAEDWDKVFKYGTCYLFMDLALEWKNPYCMESVTGECAGRKMITEGILDNFEDLTTCITEHHKTMKFSTTDGEKEGLTMLSTLLCTRGGVITIKSSGQVYIAPRMEEVEADRDIEDRIKSLTDSITGKAVTSTEELFQLSTVEVLARVIYQEQHKIAGQNAVMFSI